MVCFTYDIILINEYLFELIPYDKYKTTFINELKMIEIKIFMFNILYD